MKTIGIIPARGGSKGFPHKNIAPCAGKPLIQWTIEAAKASKLDVIVVSTDDPEIAECVSVDARVIVRPASLATDEAGLEDVVMHALWTVNEPFDAFVLLQPTSPLRTAEDIDAALKILNEWSFAMSVCQSHALLWNDRSKTRRQEREPELIQNGAIYGARLPWSREFTPTHDGCLLVMPADRSIDVDDAHDLFLAECLLKRREGTVVGVNGVVGWTRGEGGGGSGGGLIEYTTKPIKP